MAKPTPRERIEQALDQNGPYTTNIIGLALGRLLREEGQEAVNEIIAEFDLDNYGFEPVSKKESHE